MSEFAPEVRGGRAAAFRVGQHSRRGRARTVPGWLRLVVIVAISLALWALIIGGLHWLCTL